MTMFPRSIAAVFFSLLLLSTASVAQFRTYYVDALQGNDTCNGLTAQSAWQSLTKISNTTFYFGDSILFKSGCVWEGQLSPKGSGKFGKMVVISSFGTGELPKLDGKGLIQDVVYLRNQEYWGINNLEITNDSGVEDSTLRTGVHIYASDFGTVHNIFLSNLYIHNINGDLSDKENGGILCEIAGSAVQTIFDSLVITGCKIIDIDRTGISLNSSWATRTLTTNTKWIPSTNVIIRNNWIERSGCNGMIIRVSARPLIEYNTFKQCALKGSGNAMFLFNCDDGLVQFNESYLTVYNTGDADASGFDSDYQCKRSVFQYNYSHDNDGGFMLVCCQGGVGRFNDGTIVRYNISQNDGGNTAWSGRSIIRVSGQTTNTVFYNNVLYSNAATNFRAAIYHKSWAAFPVV